MTFSTHPECIVLTKGEIKRLQGPYEAELEPLAHKSDAHLSMIRKVGHAQN